MAEKDDNYSKGGAIAGCTIGGALGLIAGCTLAAATGGIAAPLIGPMGAAGALALGAKGSEDPSNVIVPGLGLIATIFGGGS
jgi:hypothetical protein